MIDRTFFFDSIRKPLFFGKLTQEQVNGISAILDEWERGDNCDVRQLAYILATVYHETDKAMQPIEEYGKGKKYKYGRPDNRTGQTYYGRGFVQLTWYDNYKKAGAKLGVDLLNKPELALGLLVATKILFAGMREGWFTGKRLKDYFNGGKEEWNEARRIINGTDKAELIAGYGRRFFSAITYL